MTTPTSMGNHGGTVTSCSPYAYPGFAEICILHRTWSTVALGTYELAFLIKKKIATPHVRLDCSVTKSPLLPSDSTICPRNGPKRAKNGLNVRCLCQTSPKPRTGRILGYVARNRIPRAPSPPATPHFLWFPSLKITH